MSLLRKPFTRKHLFEPVQPKYGDVALEICCFVSGMADAASFNNWQVFIGMQTGNTVLLGLSTASLPPKSPYTYAKTLISITCFLCGAFTTFYFHRLTQPDASKPRLLRHHVVVSFSVQTLLLILAAALCSTSLIPQDAEGDVYILRDLRLLGALPPLALQSGMQIATGRLLGFGELPSLVLTSVYCDLMSDLASWEAKNRKRDRRVAAVLLLLAGAIVGGWLMRAGVGVGGVLWVAVGLKSLISVGMWIGLKGVEEEKGEVVAT